MSPTQSLRARVRSLGGYIGRDKLEYQNDRNRIIELTAYVKPSDLESLMQYASTLGEVGNRQLSSVGAVPAGDIPNAALQRLRSVGDPSAVADSIRARVVSLGGYIGNKREYQQGTSGFVVRDSSFVRSTDLKGADGLRRHLGVPSARNLNSVGDPQAGNAPDARLLLTIMSNSGVAAEVNLNAVEPADTGRLLRERAESLGGYVERFSETRRGDDHSVDLVLVVKSSDVRDVLEYATTIADADNWEFNATGQQPPDDAPNARLDVVNHELLAGLLPTGIALGVVLALVAVIAGAIYFTGAWRMAVRSQPTLPPPDSDDDNST